MKPVVRIGYSGFWPDFDEQDNFLLRALQKNFSPEILPADQNPDFLFCSLFGQPPFTHCHFDGVRILYSGENFSADFNQFDYCISFDRMQYGDRFLRWPQWMTDDFSALQSRPPVDAAFMETKSRFCNFIYGHESELRRRESMRDALAAYKPVASAGSFENNMPDGWYAADYAAKKEFQATCRFSIAFESTPVPGFCTEKLLHAFEARSIPIYYGDPFVAETFNPDAFVNCHNYPSFEAAAQRVREIDADPALQLAMLNAPVFRDGTCIEQLNASLADFLATIFSQPPADALRRSRVYWPARFNDQLYDYGQSTLAPPPAPPVHTPGLMRRAAATLQQEGPSAAARKVLRRLQGKKP